MKNKQDSTSSTELREKEEKKQHFKAAFITQTYHGTFKGQLLDSNYLVRQDYCCVFNQFKYFLLKNTGKKLNA